VNNIRGMKAFFIALALLLVSFSTGTFGQAVSDEAKRHLDRGIAAIELANSPDDYAPAIKEFKQAVSLAPNWPDAYYDLGKAQEKAEKYSDAISSLRQFLMVAPNSNEAEAVKTLINKLEYKSEREETIKQAYDIMTSGSYSRKQVDRKQLSGEAGGRGLGLGPMSSFRIQSGKMEVANSWYESSGVDSYHPQQHPRIPREWEPVKVNGKSYEYTFSHYMDTSLSYVVRMDYEVKGEITSIDPPQVKETVRCSVTWGAPIEGNRRPWSRRNNAEEVVEYTYEYVPKGTR